MSTHIDIGRNRIKPLCGKVVDGASFIFGDISDKENMQQCLQHIDCVTCKEIVIRDFNYFVSIPSRYYEEYYNDNT